MDPLRYPWYSGDLHVCINNPGVWHATNTFLFSLEAICKIIVYGIWLPPTISTSKCFWFRRWFITLLSKNGNESSNLAAAEEEAQQSTTKDQPLTHRPYISGFANTLDIISIISYWVDFGLMIHGYPYCSLFKAIGASRPLRLAMIFKGTAVCVNVKWIMIQKCSLLCIRQSCVLCLSAGICWKMYWDSFSSFLSYLHLLDWSHSKVSFLDDVMQCNLMANVSVT